MVSFLIFQLEFKIAQMPQVVAMTLDTKMAEFCNEVAAIYSYQLNNISRAEAAAAAAAEAKVAAVAAAAVVAAATTADAVPVVARAEKEANKEAAL